MQDEILVVYDGLEIDSSVIQGISPFLPCIPLDALRNLWSLSIFHIQSVHSGKRTWAHPRSYERNYARFAVEIACIGMDTLVSFADLSVSLSILWHMICRINSSTLSTPEGHWVSSSRSCRLSCAFDASPDPLGTLFRLLKTIGVSCSTWPLCLVSFAARKVSEFSKVESLILIKYKELNLRFYS